MAASTDPVDWKERVILAPVSYLPSTHPTLRILIYAIHQLAHRMIYPADGTRF
jgi:hypothetical protein